GAQRRRQFGTIVPLEFIPGDAVGQGAIARPLIFGPQGAVELISTKRRLVGVTALVILESSLEFPQFEGLFPGNGSGKYQNARERTADGRELLQQVVVRPLADRPRVRLSLPGKL